MAISSQYEDIKYDDFYNFDAEQRSVKERTSSQIITLNIREIKFTIQRL